MNFGGDTLQPSTQVTLKSQDLQFMSLAGEVQDLWV